MYIESIIEEARDLLGDNKAPYLWSEKEMLRYYKNVINEFCRETFIYTDETTEGVCYVYLLPGVASCNLSPYIIAINSAYLSTNKSPVYPISQKILNEMSYDWRSTTGTPYRFVPNIEQQKIRVYPYYPITQDAYFIGASNATFAVTANTITVSTGFGSGIKTLSLVAGGTGYSSGTVTLTVVQSGASAGTISCTASSGGIITSVNSVLTIGSGYSIATPLATTGGGGSGCTVNLSALTGGFVAADHIVISGTSLNNGDYMILSINNANTIITTTEALVTESLTSADIRVVVDTMIMNVSRLPDMSALTVDTWDTTSPPIQERWHSKLVPGIMAQAFGKRDSETFDIKERDRNQAEWLSVIQDAKRDVILLSDDGERFNPNEGAL